MRRFWFGIVITGILATITGIVIAQERAPQPLGTQSGDEAAVRAAVQGLAKAFEKGDAAAVAAFWTENGEYIEEGGQTIRGRTALAKAFSEFFSKRKEVKAEAKTDQVRFLSKDSAIEEGTFTVRTKDTPADANRYSALYVRQDGTWQIALLKEWSIGSPPSAQMEDLAWLVGTWESGNGDIKARTTYEWANGAKKFLRATYTIDFKENGKAGKVSGTQMIGVDPATGQISAWTFDTDGGVGEAAWTWDNNRWVIDSSGTLADGTDSSATNLLVKTNNDAFTWRSVRRTLNGVELGDLPAVTVKRVSGGKSE